jgi:hypothetical protein
MITSIVAFVVLLLLYIYIPVLYILHLIYYCNQKRRVPHFCCASSSSMDFGTLTIMGTVTLLRFRRA